MKKTLLSFLLFSIIIAAKAQNLVVNGDMELYSTCPTTLGDLTATGWYNPNGASPDYFNQCNGGVVGVPNNFIGSQYAHNGVAYCGMDIFTQAPFAPEYREYVEGSLTAPLIANNCYHFEMWVNHADNSQFSTDDIGVYFSNTLITGVSGWAALPYTPQIINTNGLISDTANWVLVSGNFTAAGGESYFTIGNFNDDANTTFQQTSTQGNQFTYYLFDDVSLSNCTGIYEPGVISSEFEVYPNPAKDELFVKGYSLTGKEEIIITDVSGRIVLKSGINNPESAINIKSLTKGIYFIEMNDGVNNYRKKFLKE